MKVPKQKTFCGSDAATEWKGNVYLMTKLACPQMCHFVFINFWEGSGDCCQGQPLHLEELEMKYWKKIEQRFLKGVYPAVFSRVSKPCKQAHVTTSLVIPQQVTALGP